MFFEKRRNALRITERMGLDPKSNETTQLVQMIIAGAKQYSQMVPDGVRVSAFEKTLWSTAAMTDNASAYARLGRELRISDEAVIELMRRVRAAGCEVAFGGRTPGRCGAIFRSATTRRCSDREAITEPMTLIYGSLNPSSSSTKSRSPAIKAARSSSSTASRISSSMARMLSRDMYSE